MSSFPRPIPVIIMCAALVAVACACTVSAGPGYGTPQGTPQAENAQEATGAALVAINAQSTTPAPTRYAVPTVNEQGTAVMAIATANERVNQLQRELADQKLAALQVQAQIERAKADAARYESVNRASAAKETQSAVDMAANVAAQKEADNEAARIAILTERAQNDLAYSGAVYALALALICAMLIVNRVLNRPHVSKVIAPVGKTYFSRPWVPVSKSGHITKEIPVDISTMMMFLRYAVDGLPLGENSMVKSGRWWSGEGWREKRRGIMVYLDVDCGHIKDSRLTPEGIDYWSDWLDEVTPPTLPHDVNASETSEDMGDITHDHVNNDHVDAGGVVESDPLQPKDGNE